MAQATERLTMAQALVRFLDAQYLLSDEGHESKFIDSIFCIFGHGNVTGLGEALEFERHHLRFIRGNNEQGMVHSATAFAKQHRRRKICCVTSSIGPGATNMVTGAATATINRIPVLLLPGDYFAGRQPDPVLQQLEHPGDPSTSVNDCFRPVSKYWDRIHRPEQLMSTMLNAMAVLTDPAETGCVTICLPQDVQCESFDYPTSFFAKRCHQIARPVPEAEKLKDAVDVIAASRRPLIVAGGGVHYSHACDELATLAQTTGIPVCETQAGKGALSAAAPQNVGGVGVMGTLAANRLAATADCIVAVGTRLGDFVTASKSMIASGATQKLVAINLHLLDMVKQEPQVGVRGDAKVALAALTEQLSAKSFSIDASYRQETTDLCEQWRAEVARLVEPSEPIDGVFRQTEVLGFLNRRISDSGVVVGAAGSLPGDLQRLWQPGSSQGYHLEYGYSCMGYEVAGALGVKLADPDREVWAVVGDGSFLMMHSEIVTAIQEGAKINILLFDSRGFNCIRSLQCANGSKGFGTDLRYRAAAGTLDGDVIPLDFAAYGSALGLRIWQAKNFEQLEHAIAAAQQSDGSCLVEVKVGVATMSGGYESWWNVAVSDVSNEPAVLRAQIEQQKKLAEARPY